MIEFEFTDPHHVTAGWTGQPGARTFFVQAADDVQQVTVLLEKEQVRGLAELLTQLLARVEDGPATDWDRAAMQLREPLEPQWRAGGLSVGLDPERGRFVIELEELAVGDDVEVEVDPREVRIWADQDQARRLAAHAAEQVGQGRPTCQLCGRPTDPDGAHVCPSTNGHGRLAR
jgi:uncharacterized repeat protein (TIGR03847 family)